MREATNNEVIKLPQIRKEDVIEKIREIAQEETGRVFFLDHAEMWMKEQEITRRQIFKVLRHGDLMKGPEWSTKHERGWKCEFRRITAGECVHIAVKLVEREDMFCMIITVYNRR